MRQSIILKRFPSRHFPSRRFSQPGFISRISQPTFYLRKKLRGTNSTRMSLVMRNFFRVSEKRQKNSARQVYTPWVEIPLDGIFGSSKIPVDEVIARDGKNLKSLKSLKRFFYFFASKLSARKFFANVKRRLGNELKITENHLSSLKCSSSSWWRRKA